MKITSLQQKLHLNIPVEFRMLGALLLITACPDLRSMEMMFWKSIASPARQLSEHEMVKAQP